MYLNEFLDDCASRGLSFQTIATYRYNIRHFLEFSGVDPLKVQMHELRSFLAYLRSMNYRVGHQKRQGVAAATLNSYFSSIGSFYEFLYWEEYITNNPVPRFRKRYLRVKVQRNGDNARQLISPSRMMELLELCLKEGDILAWALIFFGAKTGLRKGELMGMKLRDINFERSEFTVPAKRKRSSCIGFLDGELTHVMQQYLEWRELRAMDTDALWITPSGVPLGRNGPYELVTKYALMLGIHDPMGPISKKFTPHCLRHFFTTHLRRAGMPREYIKELRGDTRGEAIDIYDHIDREELRKAYLQYCPKLLRIDTKQSTLVPFQ